jgi:hypothetical protein
MADRRQLVDALRRLRGRIRSDPELFARIDYNGDGNIDGEEWDRARQAVVSQLEARVPPGAAAAVVSGEVHERERREPPGEPPRIDSCDHLVLEREVDLTQPRSYEPCLSRILRSGADRAELARFEQLTTWREAKGCRRHDWDDPVVEYSIRPIHEDQVNLRRRPTMLGEEIEVLSRHGRTVARVLPRSRWLRYAFEVRAEDGRTLMLERRPWDRRCEESYRGTSGERLRPEKKPPAPHVVVDDGGRWAGFVNREFYFPDEEDTGRFCEQQVVRLEEDRLTTALRWGLIGALAFVLQGPSLMRGSIWHILGAGKR